MAKMKVPDSKGTDRLWDNIKAFLAENYAAADHTHSDTVIDEETLNEAVNAALEEAKKSGEFDGDPGESAYQIALNNGFKGTENEWLLSLQGADGKDGINAVAPYVGDNGNWFIWDESSKSFVDSGLSATQLINTNGGKPIEIWIGTIAEYNSLETIYSNVLYYILEGEVPVL